MKIQVLFNKNDCHFYLCEGWQDKEGILEIYNQHPETLAPVWVAKFKNWDAVIVMEDSE